MRLVVSGLDQVSRHLTRFPAWLQPIRSTSTSLFLPVLVGVKHLWHLYDGSKLLLRQLREYIYVCKRVYILAYYIAYIVDIFSELVNGRSHPAGINLLFSLPPPTYALSLSLSLSFFFLVIFLLLYMFYLYEFELGSYIHARSFYPNDILYLVDEFESI